MTSSDPNKMSYEENQTIKQSIFSNPQRQRSVTIYTPTNTRLTNEHKHQSSKSSSSIDQIIGFIQRKISHNKSEEKQDFDDLGTIK